MTAAPSPCEFGIALVESGEVVERRRLEEARPEAHWLDGAEGDDDPESTRAPKAARRAAYSARETWRRLALE